MLRKNKQILRKKALETRLSFSLLKLKKASLIIQNKLIRFIQNKHFDTILSYIDIKGEVQTNYFNNFILDKSNYKLAIPKVLANNLNYSYIASYLDLKPGYMNIPEPLDKLEIINKFNEKMIIITPCLLVDLNGYRLGYGKAFYDRFLVEHNNVFTVTLAYDFQITNEIHIEKHDIQVNMIITETNIFFIN